MTSGAKVTLILRRLALPTLPLPVLSTDGVAGTRSLRTTDFGVADADRLGDFRGEDAWLGVPRALPRAFLPPGVFPASIVLRVRTTWEGVSASLLGAVPRVGVEEPLGARARRWTFGRVDPPVPGLAVFGEVVRPWDVGVPCSGIRGSGAVVDPPALLGVPAGDSTALGPLDRFVGVASFFPPAALRGAATAGASWEAAALVPRWGSGLAGALTRLFFAGEAFFATASAVAFFVGGAFFVGAAFFPAALAVAFFAGAFFATAFLGARDALAREGGTFAAPSPAALRGEVLRERRGRCALAGPPGGKQPMLVAIGTIERIRAFFLPISG